MKLVPQMAPANNVCMYFVVDPDKEVSPQHAALDREIHLQLLHPHQGFLRRRFGHAGAGGSLGYADPESGVGYGYVMNQMHSGIAGDPRAIALNDAVRSCL